MNIPVTGYLPSGTCMDCEKDDKECLILKLEAYEGPHCVKCVMRAAKKRSKPTADELNRASLPANGQTHG